MRAARLSALLSALAVSAGVNDHVVRLSELTEEAHSRLTGHGARLILVDDLDLLPGPKPPESVVLGRELLMNPPEHHQTFGPGSRAFWMTRRATAPSGVKPDSAADRFTPFN
jgi:hypothetical protein